MVWAVSLSTMALSCHSLTPEIRNDGIRSLLRIGRLISPPSLDSALPPSLIYSRLALKLFRGEPAISEFDWHFTSIHRSSPCLAAQVGSALPPMLLGVQPAHG